MCQSGSSASRQAERAADAERVRIELEEETKKLAAQQKALANKAVAAENARDRLDIANRRRRTLLQVNADEERESTNLLGN